MENKKLEIIKAYNLIYEHFKRYNEYKFKFDESGKTNLYGHNEAQAFNIVLVIAGLRYAMLCEMRGSNIKKNKKIKCEIKHITKQKYNELKFLIQDINKFGISEIKTLYQEDYDDVWIYNANIQYEVNKKINNNELSDILRYGCPYPKKYTSISYIFYYNEKWFMGVANEKIDIKHERYMDDQLKKFESLAIILGGNVTMNKNQKYY